MSRVARNIRTGGSSRNTLSSLHHPVQHFVLTEHICSTDVATPLFLSAVRNQRCEFRRCDTRQQWRFDQLWPPGDVLGDAGAVSGSPDRTSRSGSICHRCSQAGIPQAIEHKRLPCSGSHIVHQSSAFRSATRSVGHPRSSRRKVESNGKPTVRHCCHARIRTFPFHCRAGHCSPGIPFQGRRRPDLRLQRILAAPD